MNKRSKDAVFQSKQLFAMLFSTINFLQRRWTSWYQVEWAPYIELQNQWYEHSQRLRLKRALSTTTGPRTGQKSVRATPEHSKLPIIEFYFVAGNKLRLGFDV